MDYSRIMHVIAVEMLAGRTVTVVGVGGAAGLARNLVRCGVRRLRLVDPDTVGRENICRQEHMADHVGMFKVDSLSAELWRINPELRVEVAKEDFCAVPDGEINKALGDTDVFVFATDSHRAQARGNEVCLRLGRPGVWIGLYPEGQGGEVAFWHEGIPSCYRCLVPSRYAAHENGATDPPSRGADVLAVALLDSVAGMVVLGLLTRGADNRYGRLIDQLGDRNFLQVKIDPGWTFGGKDVVREQLGVPPDRDTFFSFCTAARRDPEPGGNCPDCRRLRARGGTAVEGRGFARKEVRS